MAANFSEESLRKIAEEKINYRISVKIHVTAFFLVNFLLFVINALATPSIWWVIYPFLGWGTGVILHITSYIMYARGVYPWNKRFVLYNVISYASVMVLLLSIDFVNTGGILWAYIPGFFWGLGVLAHIIIYLVYYSERITKEGKTISKRERAIERELAKIRAKMDK